MCNELHNNEVLWCLQRPTNLILEVEEKHNSLVQTSNKCHIIMKLIAFTVNIKKKKNVMQKNDCSHLP